MKVSIILGHPSPGSFSHAIAGVVKEALERNGHEIYFHDLYKENFAPLLSAEEIPKDIPLPSDVERYCKEITMSKGIIIIHPNWWGQPPAILKGWIDRVIRPGVAYEFRENDTGEGVPIGLLRAMVALVFNTSNTETVREQKVFGDPLETIWKNCIFDFCGVANFYRRMFNIVVVSSDEQRKEWLEEVRQTIDKYFPMNK